MRDGVVPIWWPSLCRTANWNSRLVNNIRVMLPVNRPKVSDDDMNTIVRVVCFATGFTGQIMLSENTGRTRSQSNQDNRPQGFSPRRFAGLVHIRDNHRSITGDNRLGTMRDVALTIEITDTVHGGPSKDDLVSVLIQSHVIKENNGVKLTVDPREVGLVLVKLLLNSKYDYLWVDHQVR